MHRPLLLMEFSLMKPKTKEIQGGVNTGGKIYDCLLPFFGLTGTDLGNHLLDLLFFLIYESVSINLM